jgi:hypothetical protein
MISFFYFSPLCPLLVFLRVFKAQHLRLKLLWQHFLFI